MRPSTGRPSAEGRESVGDQPPPVERRPRSVDRNTAIGNTMPSSMKANDRSDCGGPLGPPGPRRMQSVHYCRCLWSDLPTHPHQKTCSSQVNKLLGDPHPDPHARGVGRGPRCAMASLGLPRAIKAPESAPPAHRAHCGLQVPPGGTPCRRASPRVLKRSGAMACGATCASGPTCMPWCTVHRAGGALGAEEGVGGR